jgi:hypothetical protein
VEFINITIFKGVPDEINSATTPGCGSVSGINLVKCWDASIDSVVWALFSIRSYH